MFSAESETYSVPVTPTLGGFFAPGNASGTMHWTTFDLTGDGRPDLVHTRDPDVETDAAFSAGTAPHWKVYAGTGTGFAAEAIVWPVPAEESFSLHKTSEFKEWLVRDLDGDAAPELIRTSDPNTGLVWGHGGSPHWVVYQNTGEGFNPVPVQWTLAVDPGPRGLYWHENASADEGAWALRDLDQDGSVDLVRTAPPGAPLKVFGFDEAEPVWEWYRNDGTGFLEARPFTLPILDTAPRGLEQISSPDHWDVLDLNGDGELELVVTSDGAGEIKFDGGAPIWEVFSRSETGFQADATLWTVPHASHAGGFTSANSQSGVRFWQTKDLDADGFPDFVSTSNTVATSPTVWGAPASPQWKVYRGGAGGFARRTTSWTVPDRGDLSGFFAMDGTDWLVLDTDGDGVFELAHTSDPEAPGEQVFGLDGMTPHWRVFKAVPGLLSLGE